MTIGAGIIYIFFFFCFFFVCININIYLNIGKSVKSMIQASVLVICVCEKSPCLSSKIDCIDKPAYNGI